MGFNEVKGAIMCIEFAVALKDVGATSQGGSMWEYRIVTFSLSLKYFDLNKCILLNCKRYSMH